MVSRRIGVENTKIDVRVSYSGERRALSVPTVGRIIESVMVGENVDAAAITVTFLSEQKMRTLNRETFERDRSTDVIAFGLPHDQLVVGDIYVCPAIARLNVQKLDMNSREELVRLVVHGALHVLGHDHAEGSERIDSSMWKLQEQYVDLLVNRNTK